MKRGDAIPDTWATDRQGRPTTDPRAAVEGFLMPFGGYKGYGLAVMVDLFAGVLSGAEYLTRVGNWIDAPQRAQKIGHFFIVVDTARIGDAQWLAARMADFARIVHETPAAVPARPVVLPGEIEMGHLERQRKAGIDVDPALLARLEALARAE